MAFERWKAAASRLRIELRALVLAMRDPRTPRLARLLAAAVLAYAASPIDLIPDFIPVLGHLDDLVVVPLGIWLVLRLIPAPVMAECRERARAELAAGRRRSWAGAAAVVAAWLLLAGLAAFLIWPLARGG
ncbi:MAG TPA: DUF1232 domain-containing protein [Planctomycetota bacterium]|nr:DUF1232 domain-containing protein [Planctomycetota bacterium]